MAIQLFRASFEVDECLEQIRECLEKGWTGMGFKTVEFENAWKKYTGFPNAYFLNSATAGLNLAVEILKEDGGWDDGDEVITTPNTFVSTNHAIMLAGLKPVFADIDDTLCLDPESVKSRITDRTRAVMFVGFGGNTGGYPGIVRICEKRGLKLILDAAHLAGTRLNGGIPGRESGAVVYSYQAVKNLPTADSGMVCFMDARLDGIARKKAWLGINKDTYARSSGAGGAYKWKYDVEYVGNKYNGNAVIAAIALAQLPYLDRDNEYRRQLAAWYTEAFAGHEDKIGLVRIAEGCVPSRHLFQILTEDRDGLMEHLNSKDIFPGVHYVSNAEYSMYRGAASAGSCPNADYVSEHVMSLPMHLGLTKDDIDCVAAAVKEYL
jgi:dTDP-4-amino-4,6-dideoxygalactose transaminase